MEHQSTHTAKWLVVTLPVNTANELVRVDETLARHIQKLDAVNILLAPSREPLPEIAECGELSLSVNNHKEHFSHSMVGHSHALPDGAIRPLELHKEIRGNSRLSGFWLDNGNMVDSERQFVPYKVKLHFEIIKN